MDNIYDLIVIGGGISGVSFAGFASNAYKNILLIEKDEKLGGIIDSLQFTDNFWVEMGAHTCYNTYSKLLDAIDKKALVKKIIPREKRSYKFLKNNRLESIIKQIRWGELLFSLPKMFVLKKDGLNVREYYTKVIGQRNYQHFAKKFFAAVLSQNPDDYPAKLFMKRRPYRNKDFAKSFTFTNGLQQLVSSLMQSIDYVCNNEIENVDYKQGLFFVNANNGKKFIAKKVAVATRPRVASKLVNTQSEKLSSLLNHIEETKVMSVGVICKRDDIVLPEIAGIVPDDGPFFSAVSRDVISHPLLRGFSFHFDAERLTEKKAIEILRNVLSIKKSKILAQKIKYVSLPALKKNHPELMQKVDDCLCNIKHLFLTGNYFGGLSIEDCFIRSWTEYLRMISA